MAIKSSGASGKWQRWLWTGATVCGSALAEPHWPEAAAAVDLPSPVAPVASEPPLRLSAPLLASAWQAHAALDLKRPAPVRSIGLRIVELPAIGVPGARTRPRHALSFKSEYPQRMLRSMGIEATDCATRFRMPTKLRRDAEGGSSIELRVDLGLACRF